MNNLAAKSLANLTFSPHSCITGWWSKNHDRVSMRRTECMRHEVDEWTYSECLGRGGEEEVLAAVFDPKREWMF